MGQKWCVRWRCVVGEVAARAAGRGIQRAGGAEDVGHCGEEQCGAVMD